jgi:MFS family permease
MDLMCVEPAMIGLIASIYSLAFALGGILFFLPDRVGRKKALLFGLASSLLFQLGAVMTTSFSFKMVSFAGIGFFQIKNSVSYVMLFEFVHSDNKKTACTAINVFDAIPLSVICFYFMCFGRDTDGFLWVTVLLGLLSLVLTMVFLPESPRWQLMHGQREEAIKTFNYIAQINRSATRIPNDA